MVERRNRFFRRCLVSLLAFPAVALAAIPVFRDRQRLLAVVVAADAAPAEREAAGELARVLGIMSGFGWDVRPETEFTGPGLHVGRTRAAEAAGPALKVAADLVAPRAGEIGPDGFRVRTKAGSVFIDGATPEATRFAVSWLLQREAGVRWYVPGPAGEVIPRRSEWSLPETEIVREPAYVSRELYDLGPGAEQWAVRNGLRGRLEFNHALVHVVSPRILEHHPDWAPLLRGARYRPVAADDYHWQPDLARPEVAAHAAQAAIAAFAREPARASFSLAMNDTVRFDQGEATRALVEPLRYFRGQPDYSPLVFTFMNRAAAAVESEHPGRYLGCLAYFWCENPPPFPVHPQVVPYVTTDRSQYYDPAYRAADLALMSKWGESGVRGYGLWEYAEGGNFLIPRLPLAALAEAVREGRRRGARGYFAEVGAQGGFDAYKVWMLAQLLWEPERSTEELADDFYRGYYGAAAGPMRRFFTRCEAQWMAQPGPPHWLKFYQQEDQAQLFPEQVRRELRAALDEACAAVAGEPDLAARVERTSRAFAVTEAYAAFDTERRRLAGLGPGAQAADAIRSLVRVRADFIRTHADACSGEAPAMSAIALEPFLRNDPVPRLLWLVGTTDPQAPRRILASVGSAAPSEARWRMLAETIGDGSLAAAENLTANPDFRISAGVAQEPAFLFPRGGLLSADWEVKAAPTERGRVWRVPNGPSGRALRVEGAWDTQVIQWCPAIPGRGYVAQARLRGESGSGNEAGLFLRFMDRHGAAVGEQRIQLLPKGPTAEWRALVLADQAPTEAAWVGVGVSATRQAANDWLETALVELRAVAGEGGS